MDNDIKNIAQIISPWWAENPDFSSTFAILAVFFALLTFIFQAADDFEALKSRADEKASKMTAEQITSAADARRFEAAREKTVMCLVSIALIAGTIIVAPLPAKHFLRKAERILMMAKFTATKLELHEANVRRDPTTIDPADRARIYSVKLEVPQRDRTIKLYEAGARMQAATALRMMAILERHHGRQS